MESAKASMLIAAFILHVDTPPRLSSNRKGCFPSPHPFCYSRLPCTSTNEADEEQFVRKGAAVAAAACFSLLLHYRHCSSMQHPCSVKSAATRSDTISHCLANCA